MSDAIERVLIPIIIGIQVSSFLYTLRIIITYWRIFPLSPDVDIYYDNNSPRITDPEEGKIFTKIINYLNNYFKNLKENTASFNTIKEIVERNCYEYESSITHTVALPLYLGLMATMLGVILGLSNGIDFINPKGIDFFLKNIRIAMVASLIGLFLTTLNSGVIFKFSQSANLKRKNLFYNSLETKLFPVLPGLESSLQQLEKNLLFFNTQFRQNITDFNEGLNRVSTILTDQYVILDDINLFIGQIKDLKIKEIASANIQVYKALQNSSLELNIFTSHLSNVNEYINISNNLISLSKGIYEKFDSFGQNVEAVANKISDRIELSKELMDFLKSHFSFIVDREKFISHQIINIDNVLQESLNELKDHTKRRIKEINDVTIEEDSKFTAALKENKENLGKLVFLETILSKQDLHIELMNTIIEKMAILIEAQNNIRKSEEQSLSKNKEKTRANEENYPLLMENISHLKETLEKIYEKISQDLNIIRKPRPRINVNNTISDTKNKKSLNDLIKDWF